MTPTKLVLGAATILAAAHAARAQSCGQRSGDDIIASCDAAFPGSGILSMSARGWCYLINAAGCALP